MSMRDPLASMDYVLPDKGIKTGTHALKPKRSLRFRVLTF